MIRRRQLTSWACAGIPKPAGVWPPRAQKGPRRKRVTAAAGVPCMKGPQPGERAKNDESAVACFHMGRQSRDVPG